MPRVSRPGGAGLAPEARGDADVAQRQRLLVEDLAHVQRRERHLGRPDEEEVVARGVERVDLLAVGGEEPRAVERRLAHEHRRHRRQEPAGRELGERVLHEREVQAYEVAVQVGEARAGRAGAALGVDQRAGEREVVARLEVELRLDAADRDGDAVLLGHAVGSRFVGEVRKRRQQLVDLRGRRRAARR